MRKIDDWITVLIHLMEDVVSEQLDDVSITRFGPPGLTREPATQLKTLCSGSIAINVHGSFVDKTKFAEKAN
jgi:hypothetical protein